MTNSRTLNALIGAIVTFGLSFTVVSPVIGGAVAAWLGAGDKFDSQQVGALSGLIAVLPIVLVVVLISVTGLGGFSAAFVLVLFSIGFLVAFFSILGAAGGYLGWYLLKDSRIPGQRA